MPTGVQVQFLSRRIRSIICDQNAPVCSCCRTRTRGPRTRSPPAFVSSHRLLVRLSHVSALPFSYCHHASVGWINRAAAHLFPSASPRAHHPPVFHCHVLYDLHFFFWRSRKHFLEFRDYFQRRSDTTLTGVFIDRFGGSCPLTEGPNWPPSSLRKRSFTLKQLSRKHVKTVVKTL